MVDGVLHIGFENPRAAVITENPPAGGLGLGPLGGSTSVRKKQAVIIRYAYRCVGIYVGRYINITRAHSPIGLTAMTLLLTFKLSNLFCK